MNQLAIKHISYKKFGTVSSKKPQNIICETSNMENHHSAFLKSILFPIKK